MTYDSLSNTRSRSTTWKYEMRKVRQRPEGQSTQREAPLPAREPREPVTLTIKYLGGAECWCEITTRGRTFKRPGHVALYDLMRGVWSGS
jgi:hypothetical protein